MTLTGRAKCTRLISIFVVSSLLILVSLIRAFKYSHGYKSQLTGSIMMILSIILVCCVLEMCWKPFDERRRIGQSSSNSDSSSNTNMDIPLVYSEAPPSYDEVVNSTQNASNLPECPSGSEEMGTSGPVNSEGQSEIQGIAKTPERTLHHQQSLPEGALSVGEGVYEDDFEEVYIPSRTSPFFSSRRPSENSDHSLKEIQLSVDALPTYEEAMTILHSERRIHSESTASQDNNLIMFI